MRKLMLVVAALAITACSDMPNTTGPQVQTQPQFTLGNGYPVPSFDYQMQIIGVPKGKTATLDGNNGHRIFVMLNGGGEVTNPGGKNDQLKASDVNKIFLCNSSTGENDVNDARCDSWIESNPGQFGVIDANGTDSDGAMFALPDPCPDDNVSTTACTPTYQIWVRALAGKGTATITTCAEEDFDLTNDIWCGSNGIELSKQTAFKAINVSANLLFMTISVNDATDPQLAACIDSGPKSTNGVADSYDVYLFDNCFYNYFWNYDNNGLKNLQMRFYFVPQA